ncbi:hypothetical protein HRbin15_02257 [bacterium HR15]|nr:hypothetical protein HRbin15_02257 [bacterium HR15]
MGRVELPPANESMGYGKGRPFRQTLCNEEVLMR